MELNNSELRIERIINYIEGLLSDEEKLQFQSELSDNSDLQKEVETYRDLIKGIKSTGKSEISEIISKVSDNNKNKTVTNSHNTKTIQMNNKGNKSSRRVLLMAASLALLAGAFFFINKQDNFDPDKLFAEYNVAKVESIKDDIKAAAQKTIGSRGTDGDTSTVIFKGNRISTVDFAELERVRNETLVKGLKLFDAEDWKASKFALRDYSQQYAEPIDDYKKATFYLAKSELNNGDYVDAAGRYNEYLAMENINSDFKQIAEWDRAICYLQIDQAKVKDYLDDIAKNNAHKYQDEAKGLFDYLD